MHKFLPRYPRAAEPVKLHLNSAWPGHPRELVGGLNFPKSWAFQSAPPRKPPPRIGLGPKFPRKSGISVCPAPEASLQYDPFRRPCRYLASSQSLCREKISCKGPFTYYVMVFLVSQPLGIILYKKKKLYLRLVHRLKSIIIPQI